MQISEHKGYSKVNAVSISPTAIDTRSANFLLGQLSGVPVNLNFFHKAVNETELTITAVDLRLSQDFVPPSLNLVVYADVLRINGVLRLPGKDVRIFARKIINEGGSIDVSGSTIAGFPSGFRAADGVNPGDAGATPSEIGESGGNAGNISILTTSISGSPLTLLSNGGDGGRGKDGGNGTPGPRGGNGGDASLNQGSGGLKPGGPGGTGGRGGNAGGGGRGGNGGAAGNIAVEILGSVTGGMVVPIAEGGHGGQGGNPGSPGPGGTGGTGGQNAKCITYHECSRCAFDEEAVFGTTTELEDILGAADRVSRIAPSHLSENIIGSPSSLDDLQLAALALMTSVECSFEGRAPNGNMGSSGGSATQVPQVSKAHLPIVLVLASTILALFLV